MRLKDYRAMYRGGRDRPATRRDYLLAAAIVAIPLAALGLTAGGVL